MFATNRVEGRKLGAVSSSGPVPVPVPLLTEPEDLDP